VAPGTNFTNWIRVEVISAGPVVGLIFAGFPRHDIAKQEDSQLAKYFVLSRGGCTRDNRRFHDNGHRDSLHLARCRDTGHIARFPLAGHIVHSRYFGAPKMAGANWLHSSECIGPAKTNTSFRNLRPGKRGISNDADRVKSFFKFFLFASHWIRAHFVVDARTPSAL